MYFDKVSIKARDFTRKYWKQISLGSVFPASGMWIRNQKLDVHFLLLFFKNIVI